MDFRWEALEVQINKCLWFFPDLILNKIKSKIKYSNVYGFSQTCTKLLSAAPLTAMITGSSAEVDNLFYTRLSRLPAKVKVKFATAQSQFVKRFPSTVTVEINGNFHNFQASNVLTERKERRSNGGH